MNGKFNRMVGVFVLAVVLSISCNIAKAAAAEVTVVYDSEVRFGEQFPLVTALTEYLGHFSSNCRLLAVADWQPGQLNNADTIVYVGLRDMQLPNGLLAEIAAAKRVIWFERNIEQLAKYLQWNDFQSSGVQSGWLNLQYNNQVYYEWAKLYTTQPGSSARIIATAKNVAVKQPLAWQRGNIYYSGILDFNGQYDNFTGSLLHAFFPEHQCSAVPLALLRIEDVSPLIDVENLQKVLDEVMKYNIPFSIGVIPIGIDGNKKIYLHDNQELVAVLKNAQANGASIILHGYTHQNEYSPTTGEGYEFWNARDDKPMEDEEAFTSGRLEKGIKELVRSGLLPVAFEAPHYAAGRKSYKAAAKFFNIYSGELQISDETCEITMSSPYMSKSAYSAGMTVIPENMGFYDGSPTRVPEMLDISRQLLNVPGRVACFFYHGYLLPDKIGEIISGMQQQGYKFLDLRRLPVKVQAPGINIYSENGEIIANIDADLQASWQNKTLGQGSIANKVIGIQVFVLFIIIAVLLFIIIKLQRNAKKHYEE